MVETHAGRTARSAPGSTGAGWVVACVMPEGWYTLVKRFSSKEERRRIVSSVWSPVTHPGEVAFENHLNVLHAGGRGLDQDVAAGMALWLNSSVIDRFFRTFSGHTQVNATDLRFLRFPTLTDLRSLGRTRAESQDDIDSRVMELIAADHDQTVDVQFALAG